MRTKPSRFTSLRNPVERVSWNDCQAFINTINTINIGTFRLPTEAEWEYACRAGSTTRFPWGDDPSYSQLGQYAWHSGNSSNTTHPVGQKKPNAWGLYDMIGNVWEWCSDWYSDYQSDSQTDPKGPSDGSYRILHGGGWNISLPQFLRSAIRCPCESTDGDNMMGFRIVRTAQ